MCIWCVCTCALKSDKEKKNKNGWKVIRLVRGYSLCLVYMVAYALVGWFVVVGHGGGDGSWSVFISNRIKQVLLSPINHRKWIFQNRIVNRWIEWKIQKKKKTSLWTYGHYGFKNFLLLLLAFKIPNFNQNLNIDDWLSHIQKDFFLFIHTTKKKS